MKTSEFQYPSANGRTMIHAILWEPDEAPRAVIQVAHGVTEHMGAYEPLARYLTARGMAVCGNDHLGHGLSQDAENPKPVYFGPEGSWALVVEDIRRCASRVKERFPGVPYCLLGFSLGSFAVRCLLAETPDAADMTIWAGTGQKGPVEVGAGMLVAWMEKRRYGDWVNTPLVHKLTMEAYNRHFRPCRTGMDWLMADEKHLDAYLADPLLGTGFTVGSFRELLRGMGQCASSKQVAAMRHEMPVLMLSGQEDPVGDAGRGIEAIRRQLERLGFGKVEMRLFEGMRHHIFHEREREMVFTCVAEWIERQLAEPLEQVLLKCDDS